MDIYAALADPTRRTIIELIARNGRLSVHDISRNFQSSQPAISQHLKILREVKLVDVEKRAQQRIYAINPDTMLAVEAWIHQTIRLWSKRFDALDKLLQEQKKKTIRKEVSNGK
ncbi:MAG TPA: metalloregulator ArsR/SmtB family transcription factor [Patescibacteria group bacterium]|nr:metalloregulator ArsR/SmtB family transcription factor [Patescibacteria group bacterium]